MPKRLLLKNKIKNFSTKNSSYKKFIENLQSISTKKILLLKIEV